jgi:alpha-beta hydrolase superfamily lysophospholipase
MNDVLISESRKTMAGEINLTPTCSFIEFSSGNQAIPARSWGSIKDSHAAVLLVHGLGGHSAWFETIGRRLKVKGIYSVAYDQLGFGKRGKEKLSSYSQWLDDLSSVYTQLQNEIGDKPLYLAGNSMGAVVVCASANRLQPSGLVLFSPGFDGYPETFKLSYKACGILSALFAPQREIAVPYTPELVSRDGGAVAYMHADPERRFTVPGVMLLELLKLTGESRKQTKLIKCPTLMFTSGVDRIVSNAVNTEVFDQMRNENKKRIHMGESWHDLMFDPAIDQVSDQLANWIRQASKATTAP